MSDIMIARLTAEVLTILEAYNRPLKWTREQLDGSPTQRYAVAIQHAARHNIPISLHLSADGSPRAIHDLPDELLEQIADGFITTFAEDNFGKKVEKGGWRHKFASAHNFSALLRGAHGSICAIESDCIDADDISELTEYAIKSFISCARFIQVVLDKVFDRFRVCLRPSGERFERSDFFDRLPASRKVDILWLNINTQCNVRRLTIDLDLSAESMAGPYDWGGPDRKTELARAKLVVALLPRLRLPKLQSLHLVVEQR